MEKTRPEDRSVQGFTLSAPDGVFVLAPKSWSGMGESSRAKQQLARGLLPLGAFASAVRQRETTDEVRQNAC